MHIWTTPYLNSLLKLSELPVRLVSDENIKDTFLKEAQSDDMAVIPLDDRYKAFLDAARERQGGTPVLFVSFKSVNIDTDLQRKNVLVLDLKKTENARLASIVHFILYTARYYFCSRGCQPEFRNNFADHSEDRPIEDAPAMGDCLAYVKEKEIPVLAALQICEHGEKVTARGACLIKETGLEGIVLHRFRQPLLVRAMKDTMTLLLHFTYKEQGLGAVVQIQKISGPEVHISMPTRLFSAREVRLQPNRTKPVVLYLHIPLEPTRSLRVVDISTQGVGFICSRDLAVGKVYGLTLVLPDPQAVVLTTGILRFKNEEAHDFRYGIEIQPHPWDRETIAQYIMRRESEIISFLRND
ncbi:MAG TPA: PilZ domain-containing protein [Nitrospirota bacterium]|nr:PilZ domain-containing protein [Nitrospirota bacterium]